MEVVPGRDDARMGIKLAAGNLGQEISYEVMSATHIRELESMDSWSLIPSLGQFLTLSTLRLALRRQELRSQALKPLY